MYRPHLPKKFKMKRFGMENDRKNGEILTIILPARFENHIFPENNAIFQDHFFSKMFSLKYISLIAAAAAAAAAANKKTNKITKYVYIYIYIYLFIISGSGRCRGRCNR